MKKLFLFNSIMFFIIVAFSFANVAYAKPQLSLEELTEEFTNNDEFSYKDSKYKVAEYGTIKNSNNESLVGCSMNLENENYNVFGDDPIINIIPKEYFE